MKRLPIFLFLLLLPALLVGFAFQGTLSAAPARVFVSVPPQKYFVERIGGNRVKVSVLVPAGADPHTFEPKPATMVELSGAGAWFTIGIPFEENLEPRLSAANDELPVIRTEEGIRSSDHGHDGVDPHIWLSPRLVKVQAENILQGLIRIDPAGEKVYRANARRFKAELDALDRELKTLFAGVRDKSFLVFHPSWGYLAADYGLVQVAIEVEGKEPKGADLARITRLAREKRIRVVFVEPQFSSRSARTIAESIGAKLVMADPLAANWADNLRHAARAFRQAAR
jgi:zinc transport system substrate-binding protein